MIYIDTSAAVKVLREEPDSDKVRTLFDSDDLLVASRLLAVELKIVADRHELNQELADALLARVHQVAVDEGVIASAIAQRSGLRSLDAIHLGTALHLGEIVTAVLTFDVRMRTAAEQRGLRLVELPVT